MLIYTITHTCICGIYVSISPTYHLLAYNSSNIRQPYSCSRHYTSIGQPKPEQQQRSIKCRISTTYWQIERYTLTYRFEKIALRMNAMKCFAQFLYSRVAFSIHTHIHIHIYLSTNLYICMMLQLLTSRRKCMSAMCCCENAQINFKFVYKG